MNGRNGTTAKAKGPHCESCGSTDREDLFNGDEGYTACCNELVCYGDRRHRYGTPAKSVRTCCWAKANEAGVHDGCRMS